MLSGLLSDCHQGDLDDYYAKERWMWSDVSIFVFFCNKVALYFRQQLHRLNKKLVDILSKMNIYFN